MNVAGLVLLIPHTTSVPRPTWSGNDNDRPLSRVGVGQAEQLAEQLGGIVDAVYSSPARRCVQTVEPLAKAAGIDIVLMDELREASLHFGPERTWDWMDDAMRRSTHGAAVAGHVLGAMRTIEKTHPGDRVAVCSHGDTIQIVVSYLAASIGADFPSAIDRGGWYEVSDATVQSRGRLLG